MHEIMDQQSEGKHGKQLIVMNVECSELRAVTGIGGMKRSIFLERVTQ